MRREVAFVLSLLALCRALAPRARKSALAAARGETGGQRLLSELRRKALEVQQLHREHSETGDPLQMRMSYVSSNYTLHSTRRLRRRGETLRMSVCYDLKRYSPTAAPHSVVGFSDAGQLAVSLADAGVDAILVNTDFPCYGGDVRDLERVVAALKDRADEDRPAVVMKDLVLDPIQVAQAAEAGADAVYLVASICGAQLEDLLDACSVMGVEAMVEVHTPNEAKYALSLGATLFACTNWDRAEAKLYEGHAQKLRNFLPDGIGAVALATGGLFCDPESDPADEAYALGSCGFDGVVAGRGMSLWQDVTGLVRAIRKKDGLPRVMLGMYPGGWEPEDDEDKDGVDEANDENVDEPKAQKDVATEQPK